MTGPSFLELQPPNDPTGRTPKMLVGYRTRGLNNGEPIPPSQGAGGGYQHQFFSEWRNSANMGPHDDGEEVVECASVLVNNSKGTYGSLQAHIITPGVGSAEIAVKYATNPITPSWSDFGPKLSLRTANALIPQVGPRFALPADSRVNALLLRLIRRGGDGIVTPEMWNAILTVEGGATNNGPTSDLPQDAIWGNVVFDANAMGPLFIALGMADNDDINFIPDETGRGHDLVTSASLLLPQYDATGFSGGLPCFRWGGSSVPLYTDNPTDGLGSYTYYYVIDAMDGGDGALLWGHTGGDSFSYRMLYDDGNINCANNNVFGTPTGPVAVDLSVPHIVRWTKSASNSHWKLFLDGTLINDQFNAPAPNNGGRIHCMDNLGGVGATGHIGRIAAYNKAHESPDNMGPSPTNGLTAPELILQDIWGTP